MLMFKKSNKENGEKIFRYSIRKYHFGAASVAVAALMFFANGVQAQAPAVSSATASDVVAGSSGNPDGVTQESGEGERKETVLEQPAEGKPVGELKAQGTKAEEVNQGQELDGSKPAPVGQEGPRVEEIKEREESTPTAAKTAAKSVQGTLEALLENLTLDSMKALHTEVEEALSKAKAVLENPKATQEQVDEQVKLMEDLTRRVKEALSPQVSTPSVSEEASLTNHGLAAPEGAVTEQATGGKRRKRGNLSQATPAVVQTSPETVGNSEKTESSEKPSRQELPTYTNTTEGENGVYGLKKELEDITKELRRYGASEDKIQAAKAAADKFNEAFSKGDTISQEDFAAALVDLKKSRDLIEGVLEEKYGEETRVGGVTPQPRDGGYSDFRNANYSGRSARATRAGENYSEAFRTAHESYFEKSGDRGNSPYDRYTYVYYSDRTPRNNSTQPVSNAEKYIKYTVTPTSDGFRWQLELNNGYRTLPGNSQVWFTIPSGQEFKHGTDGISISNQGGGTTAYSPNTSDVLSLLKVSQAQFGRQKEGTPQHVGATNRFGIRPMPADNLTELATRGPRGTDPYRRDYQNQEERSSADEKLKIINSSAGRLFYFELPNSNRKYKITFETRGNNDIKKLVYAAGMRFLDGNELLLANQWYARTHTEAEEDAIKELNDAKTNAISAINAEADRKNREIDSANLLPADVTKLKQQVEAAKTNGTTQVNNATSPQDVTTKKNTAVGAITGISLDEAKRNKAAKELNDAKSDAIQKITDAPTAKKAGAKELPNTGTEQSRASLALALLAAATGGLLIAKKREEEE